MPPKSSVSRGPVSPLPPRPWFRTSSERTARTTAAPRNSSPNAVASPMCASLVQYGTRILLALASLGSLELRMPPTVSRLGSVRPCTASLSASPRWRTAGQFRDVHSGHPNTTRRAQAAQSSRSCHADQATSNTQRVNHRCSARLGRRRGSEAPWSLPAAAPRPCRPGATMGRPPAQERPWARVCAQEWQLRRCILRVRSSFPRGHRR
eukprot:scaffold41446_cov64-Phaeocystis_antarctica.AAC.2